MVDTYNVIFMVGDEFMVLDDFDNLGDGPSVLTAGFELPQYLIEMPSNDAPLPMVMSYHPDFFSPRIYVRIEPK